MRKTIYAKFLVGYLIFALVSIFCVQTFGYTLINRQVYKNNAKRLYDSANIITEEYIRYIYDSRYFESGFVNYIQNTSDHISADILVVHQDGFVKFSSNPLILNVNIGKDGYFDASFFGSAYHALSDLNGLLDSSHLITISPVTHNYSTVAYVLVLCENSVLHAETIRILDGIYFVYFIIFGMSLIILVIFTIQVYKPLNSITLASKEYAKGNFSYEGLNVYSEDEIGRLADSLRFMATKFKNAEEDERKFISNVSHDFRSPLTSIKGYIEAMLDGTIPPELYGKYLNILLTETERLTKLTNNLLTLNTKDSNGLKLNLTEFDINSIIKDTLNSFEGQCGKKRIMFNVTYSAKELIVVADKGKIQQVLYNLIDNAIKFSENDSEILINVYERNEKIFVSIKDSGCGIPAESLNKIWDRFYKSDHSRGKDKSGTGLGLSIVREIIEMHGEFINVVSTEGVGTEFTFTILRAKR